MMKRDVINEGNALIYLTDCTLATVSGMAMKKSRPVYEYERQISIAQTGVDWIKNFGLKVRVDSRIYKVLSLESQKVEDWVKSYEVPKNSKTK